MTVVASSSFVVGAYANKVFVGMIQSIAGNRVTVPPPELQIFASTWSIDPQKSLVTDVDLLVTTNSPVWQLKLYQIYVEVSCLDETVTPPVEFICSNGQARIILPTHGIGLRPIRILLDKPVNPETVEIHDLSFIVTDLGRVPPQPPTVFGGPSTVQITVQQSDSVRVPIIVVGVAGVPAGTQVTAMLEDLAAGLTAQPGVQTLTLKADPKNPGVVMADSFFDVFADASAQIGIADLSLVTTGPSTPLVDTATVPVTVLPGIVRPNLLFSGCDLPPTVNGGAPCFTVSGGTVVSLTVLNNGAASSVATTIAVTGSVIGQSVPTCADAMAICTVPALSPGGSSVVKVVCPDVTTNCGIILTVDPNNIVQESNENDNTIHAVVVNAPP